MDILELGIDTSGFNESSKRTLQEYVNLFDTLSKYDGKIFNPILGGGLADLNNSITSANSLLAELNTKLSALSTTGATVSKTNSEIAQSTNQLGLSVSAYNQIATQKALIEAKLAVSGSELNREAIASKLNLSEVTKEIIRQESSQMQSVKAKELEKVKSQEYRLEQNRVVESLRALAKAQDLAARAEEKANNSAARKKRADELRAERLAVKNLADEKAKAIAADKASEKAMAQESARALALTNDLQVLKNKIKELTAEYSHLYQTQGAKSPAATSKLAEIKETASIVTSIEKNIDGATGKAQLFGGALSSAFGQLRTLAYILPGLGIAGIFNIIFEAIGNLVQEMGAFTGEQEKVNKSLNVTNEIIADQISLFNELVDTLKSVEDANQNTFENNAKRTLDLAEKRGLAKDISQPIDIFNSEVKVGDKKSELATALGISQNEAGNIETVNLKLEETKKRYTEVASELAKVNNLEAKYQELVRSGESKQSARSIIQKGTKEEGQGQGRGFKVFTDPFLDTPEKFEEKLKKESELAKKKADNQKALLDIQLKAQADYNGAVDELETKRAEKFKFDADETRKQILELSESTISVLSDKQKNQFENDLSSEKIKISNLERIRDLQIESNQAKLTEVETDTTSTEIQKQTARLKTADANKILVADTERKVNELIEEYRQRRLNFILSINSDEIENEALANEKIFNNLNKSLDDRLNAYVKYIKQKQAIQELQRVRDEDKLPLKAFEVDKKTGKPVKDEFGRNVLDKTSQLGINEIETNAASQKLRIQSDVEKKVYDIVYTSLQKQIDLIKQTNIIENKTNDEEYYKELNKLNGFYEDKKISLKKFQEEKKKIDEKFRVGGLDEDISKDQYNVREFKKFLDEKKALQIENDKEIDAAQKALDAKRDYGGDTLAEELRFNAAIGRQEAFNDQILAAKKKLEEALENLNKDEVKRAQRNYDELLKEADDYRKKYAIWIDAIANIEKQLYNFIKSQVDETYQKKIKRVEDEAALTDKAIEAEKNAVQQSTLSQKDKAALEIQLSTEKMVRDNNAAAEAKRLRREQAEFDKKAAIVQIQIETALAVVKALATIPPPLGIPTAIAIGAIGATQLAIAIATPIPSYAEGAGPEVGKPVHKGGVARFGEAGPEKIKEPYKSPYIVTTENISYLPAGTEIVPIKDYPNLDPVDKDESWEQIRWLAKSLKPKKQAKPVNNTFITIDTGIVTYKNKILGR